MRETLTITCRTGYRRSQRKIALIAYSGGEQYATLILYRDLPHWREVARGWVEALRNSFDVLVPPLTGGELEDER